MKTIQIFDDLPEDYSPNIDVSGCYVEREGKVLFLEYATTHQSEAGAWGVPAGKIEAGESPEEAAIRELFEETSLIAGEMIYLGPLFMRVESVDYLFHLFKVMDVVGEVKIGKEHAGWQWIAPEELDQLTLVSGAKEAYQKYRALSTL